MDLFRGDILSTFDIKDLWVRLMKRRSVSDLLTELEGLGALDHMEIFPESWKFWKSQDPAPSPAVEPVVNPSRPEVKPEKPPPVPDEQLQALARNLEDSYKIIHTFWTEKSRNYFDKGIPKLLQQMKKVDSNMTSLMSGLRQGKIPYGMTVEEMQKNVNQISVLQSLYAFGYQDVDFSNYMISIREITSILYHHLHH